MKYNGGTTPTHALAHNSPAIDAGKPIVCPTYDQRGWLRPIDEGNDNKILCDIGAFEFDAIQVEGSEQENSYIPSLIITN